MDRQIDQSMDPMIYRWINGSMDSLIGGPVEGRESQRECVYNIESEEHFSRYRAVPLTSQMMRNVNVNVNDDYCFTLSCKLVGRLPNIKRWKLSTANIPGR